MRRASSLETKALACAALVLCLSYALLLLLPGERYGKEGKVETITINAWRGALYLVALASSVATVAACLWGKQRQPWRAWWPFLALGLASPLLCCVGLSEELGAFQDSGFVVRRGGEEYRLLKSAFFQGSELAIVRLRRRWGPMEEYEVLVRSPWESTFGFLSVVRPQGAKAAELVLADDRMLVGIPYGNAAFLAYDLARSKPYSQIYNANEGGYVDMRNLSPFLLLGDGDAPRESDFKTLLDPESHGRPYPAALKEDLDGANPRVRGLARRLLADLRAHPVER